GRVAITVTTQKPQKFSLRARVPSWSNIAGVKAQPNTYWLLRQTWSGSQTITLDFALPKRVLNSAGVNAGKIPLARGPIALALGEHSTPGGAPIPEIAFTPQQPQLKTSVTYRDADGLPAYETAAIVTQDTGKYRAGEVVTLRIVPFASAGAYGNPFSVWLSKTGR